MRKLCIILALSCSVFAGQAQNPTLKKTVEEGIQTSIRQTENHEWSEAFAILDFFEL